MAPPAPKRQSRVEVVEVTPDRQRRDRAGGLLSIEPLPHRPERVVADWEGEPPVRGAEVLSPKSFGARASLEEAEALLAEHVQRPGGWSNYRIEEVDTTGLFQIPGQPTPRERYAIRVETTRSIKAGDRDHPRAVHVRVLDGERVVGEYDRNYAMLRTFEPFRQGDRNFALISTNYTATSVMDLETGEIIAGEEPNSWGFCPVGFYVPD